MRDALGSDIFLSDSNCILELSRILRRGDFTVLAIDEQQNHENDLVENFENDLPATEEILYAGNALDKNIDEPR